MAIVGGATNGDEGAATSYLKSQGVDNPSSGLIGYVAHNSQNYGYGEAQQYGLPLNADMLGQQQTAAIKPAVDSLTASKPEISATFDTRGSQLSAEKDPLIARYNVLLDKITGNQNKDITQQGQTLSTEYGKRGIPISSGMYQQDLTNKDTSINQNYSDQYQTTGLARESDLRDLTNQITNLAQQKVAALRDVDNQIAQLQAGAGKQAAADALQNYRTALDQKFQSRLDPLETAYKQAQINQANNPPKAYQAVQGPGNSIYSFDTLTGKFNPGVANNQGISTTGIGNYFGNTANEPRPAEPTTVGAFSPGGNWYMSNDGWVQVTA